MKMDEFRASKALISIAPWWQDPVMEQYALSNYKLNVLFCFLFLDQLSFDENKLKRHAWDNF